MNKRLKFKKSPLKEVIYQINFPPILAIDVNTPSEFQDVIRETFINYTEQIEQENQILINASTPQNNPIFSSKQTRKIHVFITEDGFWRLSLAKNMLSLSTLKYDHWEDMAKRFALPFQALKKVYRPSFYNRIALRYIDVIIRENIGLTDVAWTELLNPHICGCLGYPTNEDFKVKASKVEALLLFDEGTLKLTSGIGKINFTGDKTPGESFILDCDYSKTGKFDNEGIQKLSDSLHTKATDFFCNAITDRLFKAMEPEDLVI